jgi:hypothetical protein
MATLRGWTVQSKNATDFLVAAAAAASPAASQFNMYPVSNLAASGRRLRATAAPSPPGSIALGTTVIIKSSGTGKYCRIAPLLPSVVMDPYAAPFPERWVQPPPWWPPLHPCTRPALPAARAAALRGAQAPLLPACCCPPPRPRPALPPALHGAGPARCEQPRGLPPPPLPP